MDEGTRMGANADAEISLGYEVPYLWRDARKGRERFAYETRSMPVRVRGVPSGSFKLAHETIGNGMAVMVHEFEGDIWNMYGGCPLVGMRRADAVPPTLTFATVHAPRPLFPTRNELRRDARRMQAGLVADVREAAAARLLEVLDADVRHDGAFLYHRNTTPRGPTPESEAHIVLRRACVEVAEAGDRLLAAGSRETLDAQMRLLRRAMLGCLIDGMPGVDLAETRSIVRETAVMIASGVGNAKTRRAMAAHARTFDAPLPEADLASFQGM